MVDIKKDMFSYIPDELIDLICSNIIDIKDLVCLSLCSKRLNTICKDSKCENIVSFDIKSMKILKVR